MKTLNKVSFFIVALTLLWACGKKMTEEGLYALAQEQYNRLKTRNEKISLTNRVHYWGTRNKLFHFLTVILSSCKSVFRRSQRIPEEISRSRSSRWCRVWDKNTRKRYKWTANFPANGVRLSAKITHS